MSPSRQTLNPEDQGIPFRLCTYKVTFRRVRATTDAVEK